MNTSTSGEVIVGVDTSASGRAALEWAAAYARSTGQRVAIPRRISRSECCTWLRQHHEGRLSYLSGRGPQSVVVSYIVAGDQILLQIPEYSEIAQYAPGAEVTLAVDRKVGSTSAIQPGVMIDMVSITGIAALAPRANPPAAAGGFGESWPAGIKISLLSLPLTQIYGFERVREHRRSVDRAWSSFQGSDEAGHGRW
jgi:hypothetical protein